MDQEGMWTVLSFEFHSVLWHCWLDGREDIQSLKIPMPIIGRLLQIAVRHMLRDRCPVCLSSVCPVYHVFNIGVLWPSGWMDQDTTWCGDRLQPRRQPPNTVSGLRTQAGQPASVNHGPCLLWRNGCPSQQLLSSCTQRFCCWKSEGSTWRGQPADPDLLGKWPV